MDEPASARPDRRSNSSWPASSGQPQGTRPKSGERIAKVMARAGLCSRREAEAWIVAGRVAVNGKRHRLAGARRLAAGSHHRRRAAAAAARAHPAVPLSQAARAGDQPRRSAAAGRPSSRRCPRACRASSASAGSTSTPRACLLLTNDGGLARTLELPATGWLRRYRVRAHGRVRQEELDRLRNGITIDGIRYGSIEAKLEREQGANVVAHLRDARGQEPRGQERARPPRARGQSPDPGVVRSVPARRSAGRRGRGGQDPDLARAIGRPHHGARRRGFFGADPGARSVA